MEPKIVNWFYEVNQCYFEDPDLSLSENDYLIHTTKVDLHNYQVQNTLEQILLHSGIKPTPEVQQDITYQQLSQQYIKLCKNALGSFQHRERIQDLETWLRVNNLLAILGNMSPVKIGPNALLTFVKVPKRKSREDNNNNVLLTHFARKIATKNLSKNSHDKLPADRQISRLLL